ncbi:MAG: sulfite exporter TauE/SafE family protein [Hyphomicrobiales bacterium]|nr:sulfite exporter TauE/SafE family protein [Hyphomicrobiales bacterium]
MSLAGIPLNELLYMAVALAAAGAVTGILAGIFGVGGGAVIVPVLYELFRMMGVAEEVRMPLCVGTSLAIIIPTSIASFRAHRARGTVDMDILRAWALPIVGGVLLGSVVARYSSPSVFKLVFVLVAGVNAVRLIGNFNWRFSDAMPTGPLSWAYGFFTGLLSALMGIGGGQISNMLMMFHGHPIHRAVSTSAGIGVLIAIPGAIGYMLAGFDKGGTPPLSIGFVSLLGFILFSPVSILTAPLGVRIAHAMSKRTLELAFGIFLAIVALRFIVNLAGI